MHTIVIFGAGADGKRAFNYYTQFVKREVTAFIDNDKNKTEFCGIPVFGLNSVLELSKDNEIVVASRRHQDEMIFQLKKIGINNYFIFNSNDISVPRIHLNGVKTHYDWVKLIELFDLKQYDNIAVYGINSLSKKFVDTLTDSGLLDKVKYFITERNDKCCDYQDVPCIGLDELNNQNIDCLIITVRRIESPIRDILFKRNFKYKLIDLFDIERVILQPIRQVKRFHNIHDGERCFIVATGPSLRIEDLEILHKHNEICFGMNKHWLAFSDTKWRPQYYIIADYILIRNNIEKIYDLEVDNKFITGNSLEYWQSERAEGSIMFREKWEQYLPNMPGFSDDASFFMYCGFTVTYIAMQMAYYMGFKNIYLLGVDCSYSKNNNVNSDVNHFVPNYIIGNEGHSNCDRILHDKPDKYLQRNITAYKMAEKYSRQNGFRIYNATRGGALEVFQRVDFDSLF